MENQLKSGILLHPTSLSSPFGIGDLGPDAFCFIDFLAGCKQGLWQILPLNPPGWGESPYQCFSAFAGNPLLISPLELYRQGLLTGHDLSGVPVLPKERVDFSQVRVYKETLFNKAYRRFIAKPRPPCYHEFMYANGYWLRDYALFMALKKYFGNLPWNRWDKPIAWREPEELVRCANLLIETLEYHYFLQYVFHTQWTAVKKYAAKQDILIIGDLPLYVSDDSSDAWAYPRFFELDARGDPAKVAGVPPDYFSKTGQRWGNPLYRWEVMAEDNYAWWQKRIKKLLEWVDVIRIDHFRGFEAYWEIPAYGKTAVKGRWVKGPGEKFFSEMINNIGPLPIIAEDLGYITAGVEILKDKFGFPGMKVLQFINEEKWPRKDYEKVVFYTGTHDNDTLRGWYRNVLQRDMDEELVWEFIEIVMQSSAAWVIIPLQDVLCLDHRARMNTPGTTRGNWRWRFLSGSLTKKKQERLAQLAVRSKRINDQDHGVGKL